MGKNRSQKRRERFLKKASQIKALRQLARQAPWRETGRRHLSHWDNLLEEMKWMAQDFRQETKWKEKQAKLYSRRCIRAMEEGRTNEQQKDAEEEKTKKRECSKIAKDVQRFWSRATKVVQFKVHQRIEAKKRSMLDKHLHFLVSQTERYSNLLAKNLTARDVIPSPKNRPSVNTHSSEDSDIDDDIEDERKFEEEAEQELNDNDTKDELVALNAEAELSLEELMQQYRLSVGKDCIVKHESSDDEKTQKRRRLNGESPSDRSVSTRFQPDVPFLLKHTLREYQRVGLDWLVTLHKKQINGILADEMGLGKTIQTIALLAWLAVNEGAWGPHLIVVPTSVMLNWEMEFKKWCPAFKLLTYYGSAKQRKLKRQGWSKANSFHVCITSYALVLQDSPIFRRKKWNYLILDEAHMIKNWKSQRWQTLLKFNSRGRLLLTGTPLQNNLMELWSLMHFLMPHVFSSHAHFKNWFCNPLNEMAADTQSASANHQEVVPRLHAVLRPFILRRLKSEVEQQLPQKHEHVIYCSMSKRQKKLYEEYMASAETQSTLASNNFMGIINVLMQLRKVCNHPDLFEGRAIVSPFDVEPIIYQLPSLLARLPSPNPKLLYNLGSERLLGGDTWVRTEVSRLCISLKTWIEMGVQREQERYEQEKRELEAAALDQEQVLEIVAASISRLHQARMEARVQQLGFMYSTNLRRYPTDTFAPSVSGSLIKPWYWQLSGDWVKSNARRSMHCRSLIETFMCVIPKVRCQPASHWFSIPDRSVVNRSRQLALLRQREYDARKEILWPAIVRSRLYFPDRRLVQFDCGKLQTLAVLLRRLQSEGHRTLIFTQMSRVLDVLEEFLNIHGYHYLRLDGSTKPDTRQALMQRFNHDTRILVFILSTRSGGVGVNLTGADTVIFYDSDWNPAMDKQAQDRCHRIGQTREVNIYRLVTRFTIEENILKKSEEKRQLDFLAIQSGEFNLQFLQRLNPTELMDKAVDAGISVEDVKTAMRYAEDETDAEAAKVVEQETAAELAEFSQEEVTEDDDEKVDTDDDQSEEQCATKSDLEEETMENERIQALLESCSAIERYAIAVVEQTSPVVDVEQSASLQLDGLNEDEWELQKLEELKELNEEDIQKEEFRVVDWDKDRANDVYQSQVETVRERLEKERRLFMEAEQRKHNEYLRRLTAQQASLNASTAVVSAVKVELTQGRIESLWKSLWATEGALLPWSREDDVRLCLLSEAILHGIVHSALRPVGNERLTLPNGVGSAISLVFDAGGTNRCGVACKERLRQLLTIVEKGAVSVIAQKCRRLYETATAMTDASSTPVAATISDADAKPDALSVSVSSMVRVSDVVCSNWGAELQPVLQSLQTALTAAGPKSVGEEYLILSFAAQGLGFLNERLKTQSNTATMSRPFTSSVCHGRPWTASATPLHMPVHSQSLRPSSSGIESSRSQADLALARSVMNAPSLLVHPDAIRSYLDPPQPRSYRQGDKAKATTVVVPFAWSTRMIDKEQSATRPTVALGLNHPTGPQQSQETRSVAKRPRNAQ